jgi:ubiquinone/menaquinone biosynthesis C-methylase UbiE
MAMDAELMDLFAMTSVISAAQQMGLIRALQSGPRTAQALAGELGLDGRATGLVLDVLVAFDLASRSGDAYDASPRVKAFLRPWGQPGFSAENLLNHTPAFLRTGEPFVRMDGAPAEREASYRTSVSWLAQMLEGIARELASKIEPAPARVLDVGCGSGVWSLAIAERCPSTHVTGLDLPAVLESFLARAGSLNLGDRVSSLPGDMHAVPLPAGAFDLVLIANVVRLETQERAAALLARLATAVAPGGALLVVDALAGGTPETERARALYAINLALRTQHGRVHSPGEISAWLAAAGLPAVQAIHLGEHGRSIGAIGALSARRQPSTTASSATRSPHRSHAWCAQTQAITTAFGPRRRRPLREIGCA